MNKYLGIALNKVGGMEKEMKNRNIQGRKSIFLLNGKYGRA